MASPPTVSGHGLATADGSEISMTFEPLSHPHPFVNDPTRASESASAPSQLGHRRQSTAPSLTPLNTSSRPSSPQRGHLRRISEMAFTGDARAPKSTTVSAKLSGWLGGGSPARSINEDVSVDVSPSKQPATPSDSVAKSSSMGSRFGFITSSVTTLTQRLASPTPTSPQNNGDDLLNLSIESALYPGVSSEQDAFSPAAYKNLQTNAIGVLLKMQSAYRQKTIAFNDLQAERAAEQEEAEETQLRVKNLKVQLEHMAQRAAEQEKAMQELMNELLAEKKGRAEERAAWQDKLGSEGSVMNEDLDVDEAEMRKKWRVSRDTVQSEVSFDTDEESAASESVFSRSRSPTSMSMATDDLPPTPVGRFKARSSKDFTPTQKSLRAVTSDASREEDDRRSPESCRNCRGQDSNMAWNTVTVLRDENKDLKQRVTDLEVAVESAIDLVSGVGVLHQIAKQC